MITNLKPYPAYKDSGVPWLGEVPEHWDVRRLGSVTQILNGATPSSSRPEYWDGDIVWVTPDDLGKLKGRYIDNSSRRITQEGYNACGTTLAPAGSIILSTRAPIGHLGILRVAACANQGCRLLVPQAATASEFLYHMLVAARPSLEVLGQGSTFLELSRSKLGTFPIPFPPLPEQTAIVRFLDWAEQRIRRVIRARQRRIKLLEEYKQALIHQAVTGKIDVRTGQPYPAYKPSGVEWLGEVPAHWEVAGLRYVTSCLDGRRVPLNAVERGSMQGPYPYWGANKIIDYINDYLFDEPLVLLGEDGAPFFEANKEVAFFVEGKIWVNNHAHVIRCKGRVQPRYLVHVLNLTDYTRFVDGSTRDKLTQQAMGSIPVILPRLEEQTAIVEYLDAQATKINAAITAARREIDLLREYRTRLIADVVTGKVDVREVAAQLPDEQPEEEAELMHTDEIAEGEATDDETAAEALSEEEVEP